MLVSSRPSIHIKAKVWFFSRWDSEYLKFHTKKGRSLQNFVNIGCTVTSRTRVQPGHSCWWQGRCAWGQGEIITRSQKQINNPSQLITGRFTSSRHFIVPSYNQISRESWNHVHSHSHLRATLSHQLTSLSRGRTPEHRRLFQPCYFCNRQAEIITESGQLHFPWCLQGRRSSRRVNPPA